MRHASLIALTIAIGLGACAPVPAGPYGYAPQPAPVVGYGYGYYDGGYAPGPVYAEPGYQPYVAPGPTIIVGSERRWDRDDRYRYDRPRDDRGFRGNPPPPGREFGRQAPPPGPQGFAGNRPGPGPAAARPVPQPQAVPPPPAGGPAFEQWNRTHVNASPTINDTGAR